MKSHKKIVTKILVDIAYLKAGKKPADEIASDLAGNIRALDASIPSDSMKLLQALVTNAAQKKSISDEMYDEAIGALQASMGPTPEKSQSVVRLNEKLKSAKNAGPSVPAENAAPVPEEKEVSKEEFKAEYFKRGNNQNGWTKEYWKKFYEKRAVGWRWFIVPPASPSHDRMTIITDHNDNSARMVFFSEHDESGLYDYPGKE